MPDLPAASLQLHFAQIVTALTMPRDERMWRWRRMMGTVEREDVHWWPARFTHALLAVPAPSPALVPDPLPQA